MTVEPRKAAAVIILSSESTPQILMARRSLTMKFAPGHHVFPGGCLDRKEGGAHVLHAPDQTDAEFIHAAAREVFEETGLLCATGDIPPPETARQARRALHQGEMSFDAILERFSLTIDAGDFIPAGVWVTPVMAPLRFDTRYYLYHYRGGQHPEVVEGEITGLDWLTPATARASWRAGELKLSPPVAYVLQYLAAFELSEALPHLRRNLDRPPGIPGRMEVRCGVHVLPLVTPTLPPATHTNAVLVGERELLVIDPGPTDPEEQDHLVDLLGQFLALDAKLKAVILTHSHIDHVGAAERLRDQFSVPIWAHEGTARQVIFSVDRLLRDNEIVESAGNPPWRLRCIYTPGHDPGHLCLLEETTRTLLAGDMVANPGTVVISDDVGGDMTAYLESLERLLTEDFALLVPSHGVPPRNPHGKIRELIEHRLQREQKIKRALEQGLTAIDELIAAVYDDVSPEVWPLARHSLQAHLRRLGYVGTGLSASE